MKNEKIAFFLQQTMSSIIIELTVDFENNLNNNARRKELKHRPILTDLANDYKQMKLAYLSIIFLGIFGNSFYSFLNLFIESGIDNSGLHFNIFKTPTIVIRSTYYICSMRRNPWSNPELLSC